MSGGCHPVNLPVDPPTYQAAGGNIGSDGDQMARKLQHRIEDDNAVEGQAICTPILYGAMREIKSTMGTEYSMLVQVWRRHRHTRITIG